MSAAEIMRRVAPMVIGNHATRSAESTTLLPSMACRRTRASCRHRGKPGPTRAVEGRRCRASAAMPMTPCRGGLIPSSGLNGTTTRPGDPTASHGSSTLKASLQALLRHGSTRGAIQQRPDFHSQVIRWSTSHRRAATTLGAHRADMSAPCATPGLPDPRQPSKRKTPPPPCLVSRTPGRSRRHCRSATRTRASSR